MKKFLCLLLAVVMMISMVACSSSDKTSDNTPTDTGSKTSLNESTSTETGSDTDSNTTDEVVEIDFDEEPYTLKISYAVMSEAQPDLALIQEKLNEITLREINAKVELEAVSLFNMANVYALKASSQEKMDLILLMPGYTYLSNFANSNLIKPIGDELDLWGSDIKEVLGEQLLAGQFNGQQYGVPQNSLLKKNKLGFNMSKAMIDKYNIDISTIKTYEDMDPIFEMIHENEPDMTIILPESTGGNITGVLEGIYDPLGGGFGVLKNGGIDDTTVINSYETEEFMNASKKVREWYLKGYIPKDVAVLQEAGSRVFMGGNVFSTAVHSVGPELGFQTPIDARAVVLYETSLFTTDSQLFMWAVPTSAERPDKSIQFLNLMDASAEVGELLRYGIEGTHYQKDENNIVTIDSDNESRWRNNWVMFGDAFKVPLSQNYLWASPDGTVEGCYKLYDAWNSSINVSKAYGFTFDPTLVKTEIAACDAVGKEYIVAIANGTVDPETEIPEFNKKLYSAGLQSIIDEKQRQLDEWLANQ
jgi:putative aldouronate transport system substrate-binding protein